MFVVVLTNVSLLTTHYGLQILFATVLCEKCFHTDVQNPKACLQAEYELRTPLQQDTGLKVIVNLMKQKLMKLRLLNKCCIFPYLVITKKYLLHRLRKT